MNTVDTILQEIESLKVILSEKEKTIHHKNSRIKILEDYIQALKQKQFGASSEKLEAIQPDIFGDTDELVAEDCTPEPDAITVAEHQRKTKRASIPKELPRVDVIHDLPDTEKFCPHDGTALKRIGSETHDQLDIIPATIQVLHHIRFKYACPCCEQYLITAKKPAQPIEKSIASPGLLAFIATQSRFLLLQNLHTVHPVHKICGRDAIISSNRKF